MDPAEVRRHKERLLDDIKRWKPADEVGFRNIVRNGLDLDTKILRELMKGFNAKFQEVRGWGGKGDLPADIDRYFIVEKIRELLESELGAVTEVKD